VRQWGNASSHTKLTTGLPSLAIERLGFWLWEETHHYEHHIIHIDRLPTFPFIGWTTFHLDSTLHGFKTNQNPGQLILGVMETSFLSLSTQHNTIPKQTKNPATLFFLPLWRKNNTHSCTVGVCVCVCVCVCEREREKGGRGIPYSMLLWVHSFILVQWSLKSKTNNYRPAIIWGLGGFFFFFFISVGGSLLSSFSPTRVIGQLLKLLQKVWLD
jgi:hypothetical protein